MRLRQRRWLFNLDGTIYRGEALIPGPPLLSSAALPEACAAWDLGASFPILQGVCSLRGAVRRRSPPCAAARRRGCHAALGEGVSVATMAVPGNAVWCSKTLRKGLKSSQNVIGKVIEFYGLDLAP